MKKIILVLCVLVSLQAQAGDVYSTTLPAGQRLCIVPPRGVTDAAAWATNTVTIHGSMIKTSNRIYMCMNTGTVSTGSSTTNAPTHLSGDATCGTTNVKWRRVRSGTRASAEIGVLSGGPVMISEGANCTTNVGANMTTAGSSYQYTGQQDIWAVSVAASVMTVAEIEQPGR